MNYKQNKTLLTILLMSSCLLLNACTSFPPRLYKLDIEQGNRLSLDQINSIEVGMSQDTVQATLGMPVLKSAFHPNRWDYTYYNKPGYGNLIKQDLTLFFKEGHVSKIIKRCPS